jgi:hypothetical protein
LPTDFEISDDGKSAKGVCYINNLHPLEHAELRKMIEELIAAHVSLFERVLTDSMSGNAVYVIAERTVNKYSYDDNHKPPPDFDDFEDPAEHFWAYEEWEDGRPISLPAVKEGGYIPGLLEKREIEYKLRG